MPWALFCLLHWKFRWSICCCNWALLACAETPMPTPMSPRMSDRPATARPIASLIGVLGFRPRRASHGRDGRRSSADASAGHGRCGRCPPPACAPGRRRSRTAADPDVAAKTRDSRLIPNRPRAEQETHRVSPPATARPPPNRLPQARQRPVPGPADAERPPMAGRALAGGFGPPAWSGAGLARDLGGGLGQWWLVLFCAEKGGQSRGEPRPTGG